MSNQHTTAINGSGNPTFKDLKKVASERNVKRWQEVLDSVRGAFAKWPQYAGRYDLTNTRMKEVQRELQAVDKACGRLSW